MPGVFCCGFFRPARRPECSCYIAAPPVREFPICKHETVKFPAPRNLLRPFHAEKSITGEYMVREYRCVQFDDVRHHSARRRMRNVLRHANPVLEVLEPVAQFVGNAEQCRRELGCFLTSSLDASIQAGCKLASKCVGRHYPSEVG